MPAPRPPIAFTLVHGTWAPKARWAQLGSPLRRALLKRFGEDTPIDSVAWGGWNRVGTRSRGALALADHIKNTPDVPGQQHFVIAHSHGGNLALYALRDKEVKKRVAGVVTMATPFLVARKRELGKSIHDVPWHLLLLPFLAAFLALGDLIDRWNRGWLGAGVLLALMIVVGGCLYSAVRWWRRFASSIFDEMDFPEIAEDRLLIMRSPADEASVLLQAARAALSVGMLVFAQLTRLYAAVDRLLVYAAGRSGRAVAIAAGGVLLSAVLVIPVWMLGAGGVGWKLGWTCLVFVLVFLPGFAVLVREPDLARVYWEWLLAVFLILCGVLPSLPMLFYGWQIPAANLALDVSAEATPLGRWRVLTLAPNKRLGEDGAPTMVHSALYDDEEALARLCDWVEARATGKAS